MASALCMSGMGLVCLRTCLLLQALAGPHFYTWGDHGGILMAIGQGGATTKLK